FLSKKPGRRVNELKRMREHEGILVIYESPHRIRKTLTDIKEVFPHREVVIGREMTKKFEEYIRLNATDMDEVLEKLTEKGEFAIAILNKELKFSSDEED
ncbi:MAG TPA: rRNA (cytidine-2'-O-)-methyltransferase, partial [Spirochaetota bacterium]|nr:rRNA (cytidine-2'-O-)-methyltransferase [Spirochaetota bacterium]